VENTGSNVLLFSVGAHPAFNVPLVPGTQYTDHYLQFEACEPMNRWKLKDGLLTHVQETVPAFMGRVKLEPELFYEDALVFRHLQSASVTLASTTHKHSIKCSFPGFPFLGIWAAKDAPFVCIEPWCGHADFVGHNLLLDEKAGIINLAPGLDWRRTWQLELR
jgi:galactose mutarotase-like enzyme